MRGRALALLSCALLLLSGCNGTGEITSAHAPDDAHRLTVYTSHKEEVYWPIVEEFEERTGIWVEVVEGGTNDLLERIDKGFDNGQADVMFGGGVENLSFYAHCFTPYVCVEADAIDPQFASPDGLWTPFSALPVVLVYNPKLVSAGEIIGWADLLSPTFRGKIAFADPAVSGSSFTALVTMVQALGGDEEAVLTAFAENLDGRQLSGSGAVLDAVVDGAAWVGVTLEETALKYIAAGDDVVLVYPAEGTSSVPDAGALVRDAPHEANAKLFLDFIAGEDVQELLTNDFCRRSVRADVASAGLPGLDNIALIDYDVVGVGAGHDALLDRWAALLGGEGTP